MIDIYAPIMSTRSLGMKYTAQGLGDRIHLISLCYEISISMSQEVTLHLAKNHLNGKKRDSFNEILQLFPNNFVNLKFHEFEFQSSSDWQKHLLAEGISALSFEYRDHPGWLENPSDIDASQFLYSRHLLEPVCDHNPKFPRNFVTVQWDSTGKDRQLPNAVISNVEEKYRAEGLIVVRIGGQSDDQLLKECLRCSAVAIYKSQYFVGVDSGFLHLALQIKKPAQIHFYTSRNRYWSHHTFRAIEVGTIVNRHWRKLTTYDKIYAKFRYDSPKLTKLIHNLKRMIGLESYETHD